MKHFDSILAAYMVFWAIVFGFQFTISRRQSRAEAELEKLKHQLGK
ncbi:MAG TPA: CcmD family protein [Candidatus Acidoferrales bacterium]|nr:CcmD family protein [Candidatus Acidoferrales bacterium]